MRNRERLHRICDPRDGQSGRLEQRSAPQHIARQHRLGGCVQRGWLQIRLLWKGRHGLVLFVAVICTEPFQRAIVPEILRKFSQLRHTRDDFSIVSMRVGRTRGTRGKAGRLPLAGPPSFYSAPSPARREKVESRPDDQATSRGCWVCRAEEDARFGAIIVSTSSRRSACSSSKLKP